MADQCTLDEAGNLLPASSIDFYESESDEKPLNTTSGKTHRRSSRKRNTDRLTESLAAEVDDDNGNALVPRVPRPRAANSACVKFVPESPSEEEDTDFSDSELPELLDVSDSEDEYDSDVDNDQISDLLASKTVPARSGAASVKPQTCKKAADGSKRKQSNNSSDAPAAKACRATVEEVEDEGDAPKTSGVKNPIYLFYDTIPKNAEGHHGKEGDKHYKCRHGSCKIITIMKAMR
ncbi:hypothetical protein B0H19DRAFT_1264968 [Mycena capillaripes]|nr:hypothetical protein B0H19DRAFT_1264968 [Mycena capillaripes]